MATKWGGAFSDDNQRTKICFLSKTNEVRIELVEPYEDNRTMQKTLKKNGGTAPYHVCYVVNDILKAKAQLESDGYYAMFEPVEAIAFENRKICYLFKDGIGYVELVNK